MKSHISVPKSFLRRWAVKSKEGRIVKIYDIKKDQLYTSKINQLFTEEGYYTNEQEKYLSDNVESLLGDISKRIVESQSKKIVFKLEETEIAAVRKAIHILMLRNPKIYEKSKKEFRRNNDLNINISHGDLLMEIVKSKVLENNNLEGFSFNILFNNTVDDLVLPATFMQGIYPTNDGMIYMFPINPKIALLYGNTERSKEASKNRYYLEVTKKEDLFDINCTLIIGELKQGAFTSIVYRNTNIDEIRNYLKT